MILPEQLREALRPLLPERAFLRRSRGEGTFITNAPRFVEEDLSPILARAGFLVKRQDSLLILSPGPSILAQFEQDHSPSTHLAQSLARFRGQPPCREALSLFAVGVRLLENATVEDWTLYDRRVRQLAALSLRKNLGGVYACALILNQNPRGATI